MPYGGVGHFSRYRDTTEYIYLEEDDGQVGGPFSLILIKVIFQFKIQRRSRFRLHPGISSDTRDTEVTQSNKDSHGATGVLQFHGWEKGSPIIATNGLSDDDDAPTSGNNPIISEYSSFHRF